MKIKNRHPSPGTAPRIAEDAKNLGATKNATHSSEAFYVSIKLQ